MNKVSLITMPTITAQHVQRAIRAQRQPTKAQFLQRFFKTGPGQYAAGDRFLGLTVPQTRLIIKSFYNLPLIELQKLIRSPYHEERLAALLIAARQYAHADDTKRRKLYTLYLNNTRFINNWDLVDCSAEHIVGPYLQNQSKQPLLKLTRSKLLWERRIAMLATFHYIKQGQADVALTIAKQLVHDQHDLIQKAVGWMLREIGKRCSIKTECTFLDQYAATMPRTMLRYAIEKFPPTLKKRYMSL